MTIHSQDTPPYCVLALKVRSRPHVLNHGALMLSYCTTTLTCLVQGLSQLVDRQCSAAIPIKRIEAALASADEVVQLSKLRNAKLSPASHVKRAAAAGQPSLRSRWHHVARPSSAPNA